MASTITSPRGVLTARDINAPTSPRKTGPSSTSGTLSPREPTKLFQAATPAHTSTFRAQSPRSRQELDVHNIEGDARSYKRARTESYTAPSDIRDMALAGLEQERANSVREDSRSRATTPSPAASFASSTAVLNDSQNTTFTEPDDLLSSFSRPANHRLTKGEARQKADALKLRLRLASYRVFTNQLTTPFKNLEARTMPLGTLRISQSSPIQPSSSFDSSRSNQESIPYPRSKESTVTVPSSPPGYSHTRGSTPGDVTADGVRASIPPSRQQGNPTSTPSSFSVADREDLTEADSAAKRSMATAGLLSLMRQQEARAI